MASARSLAGSALGLFGAWALGRTLGALSSACRRATPQLRAAAVALSLAALAATLLPARRAVRVDPAMALSGD